MKTTEKSYTPTEAVRNNSRRGLALQEKYNRSSVTKSNKDITSKLSNGGSLTLDDVKQLYNFLTKSHQKYKPLERLPDGGPSTDTIDHLSMGSNSGLAWCRQILRSENILKSYKADIAQDELEKEDNLPDIEIKIIKSTDEILKQVTYVVMKADFTDAHGDYTSSDEVRKAKESFNRALLRKQTMSNLFHMFETNTFDVIESYIAPADMNLNGHFVSKGDWLMTLQINDDSLWDMIVKGEIVGLSIGAIANIESVEE